MITPLLSLLITEVLQKHGLAGYREAIYCHLAEALKEEHSEKDLNRWESAITEEVLRQLTTRKVLN